MITHCSRQAIDSKAVRLRCLGFRAMAGGPEGLAGALSAGKDKTEKFVAFCLIHMLYWSS
jgi:hypothetical protein